jgi:hypothetical protein
MNSRQQILITQKLTVGDPAIGFVETPEYTIEYYGFIGLGNTNDTVIVTLNGVEDVPLSMMGMIECPIESIEITAVNPSLNETTPVYRGILLFGIKKFKTLF